MKIPFRPSTGNDRRELTGRRDARYIHQIPRLHVALADARSEHVSGAGLILHKEHTGFGVDIGHRGPDVNGNRTARLFRTEGVNFSHRGYDPLAPRGTWRGVLLRRSGIGDFELAPIEFGKAGHVDPLSGWQHCARGSANADGAGAILKSQSLTHAIG